MMLKNSLRVLKNGGKAIFSVWGNENNCKAFSLISKLVKEIDSELP